MAEPHAPADSSLPHSPSTGAHPVVPAPREGAVASLVGSHALGFTASPPGVTTLTKVLQRQGRVSDFPVPGSDT